MLLDKFNRRIDYLRISVTDRCNYRCIYCMLEAPFMRKSHSDILSYEQIESVAKVAAGMGIRKIRLTGGEPLVRKDIERLVARLAAIDAINEVCMTTNGSLLVDMAMKLTRSGLSRVNISIDSLDADKFGRITRGGDLRQILAGVFSGRGQGPPAILGLIFIMMALVIMTFRVDAGDLPDCFRSLPCWQETL